MLNGAKRVETSIRRDWRRGGSGFKRPASPPPSAVLSPRVMPAQRSFEVPADRTLPTGDSCASAEWSADAHQALLRTQVNSTKFASLSNAANPIGQLARDCSDDPA